MKLALSKMNENKIDGIKIFSMEIQDDSFDQFTKSRKYSEEQQYNSINKYINNTVDWQNLGKPSLLRRKMISSQKLNGKSLILNSHKPNQLMDNRETLEYEPESEKMQIIELSGFVDYSQTPQQQLQNSQNDCILDGIDMFVQVQNDKHQMTKIQGGIQNYLQEENENGESFFDINSYVKEVMMNFYDSQFERGYHNCSCRYCCILEYPILIEKGREPKEFEKLHQKYAEFFMKNPDSQTIYETQSQQDSNENIHSIENMQNKQSFIKYSNLQLILF
ncbi:UNKNOWN [Stylonychia lemnae]|uniref:Uncharacterized protein n=1 Tax=Stylonychia lemnae TaxID=5949 RepID=A0A078APL0_STYLE|nr:UNKNOWN [Stylonychia lemnae]|eukprot:CDW84310.1 UNKNOWN [Stylonychia lemnae]